jgi:hypothetical protein
MVTTTEISMKTDIKDSAMLDYLAKERSATIEQLMKCLDMSWEEVFAAVDRLSRCGGVRLMRAGGDYYVERSGDI